MVTDKELRPIFSSTGIQECGVGVRLMEQVPSELHMLDASGCVVFGDPGCYSHFGFKVESLLILPGVPSEYFQAIAFGGAAPFGTGYHTYVRVFYSAGLTIY